MTRNKAITLATLTAIGIAGGTLAVSAERTRGGPELGALTVSAGGWRHHGRHGRHGMTRLCSPARDEKVEGVIDVIEAFVTFTPEQRSAWDALTTAVRASRGDLDAACETVRTSGPGSSLTARLGRLETMLGSGLTVLRKVRPPLESFYHTLDDEQRAAVDAIIERRHRPRHTTS